LRNSFYLEPLVLDFDLFVLHDEGIQTEGAGEGMPSS
jgi:hypothetical protein